MGKHRTAGTKGLATVTSLSNKGPKACARRQEASSSLDIVAHRGRSWGRALDEAIREGRIGTRSYSRGLAHMWGGAEGAQVSLVRWGLTHIIPP